MNRQDCEKYRLWKKERERKLGLRKRRRKEPRKEVTDCVEEIEEDEEQTEKERIKPEIPKCEEKSGKVKRPRLDLLGRTPDPVEILLGKIQPGIEIRDQFFNERHLPCLDVEQKLDLGDELDGAIQVGRKNISSRKRPRARGQIKQRKDEEKEKEKEEEDGSPMEEEAEAGAAPEKKRKRPKKRPKRKRTEDRDTRRRRSVNSFDSYVCLADIKLTAEEKKKIEGYQSKGSKQ